MIKPVWKKFPHAFENIWIDMQYHIFFYINYAIKNKFSVKYYNLNYLASSCISLIRAAELYLIFFLFK
jgi:hypothetical protein